MQSSNDIGHALIRKIAPCVEIRHGCGEATLVAALAAT
jgi:hypothetical protein